MWRLGARDEEPVSFREKVEMKRKEYKTDDKKATKEAPPIKYHKCTSICWDAIGKYLFAGFTDSIIRVYELKTADK